jgi:two-component system response regulator MprA
MSVPKILIVEDDPEMAQLLVQALTESGFSCQSAANGIEGLESSKQADLVLVDVMMPEMGGFEMVSSLRKEGSRTPVIFVTAKDQTKDVVHGLEIGADDYLIKPFKLDELIARVRAALRRAKDASPMLHWEEFALNCVARTAFRGEHELFFSATEIKLFELFMRKPGVIVSKAQILRDVWSDEGYRDENIVELYINYLRKKTESFGGSRVIYTVRGQGYVLGTSVSES